MNKDSWLKKILVFGIIVLFIGASVVSSISAKNRIYNAKNAEDIITNIVFDRSDATMSKTIIYVDDDADPSWYDKTHVKTIQEGINNASSSYIVYVYSGTYSENVVVDKSINLTGEDRDTTVIDPKEQGDAVFISTEGVNITGFTIQNSGEIGGDAGIDIRSDYNTIHGNNISNNKLDGIVCSSGASSNNIVGNNIKNNTRYGIGLYGSLENNNISGNTIEDNDFGIELFGSGTGPSDNIMSGNTINNNAVYGISLYYANRNTISGNTFNKNGIRLGPSFKATIINNTFISNNGIFIVAVGDDTQHRTYTSHTIENNTADGRHIRYYKNKTGVVVPDNSAQVILASCTNFTIQNLSSDNIDYGIQLGFSSDNTIVENTVDNIKLYNSSNNLLNKNHLSFIHLSQYCNNTIISDNTIDKDETDMSAGIWISKSSDNIVSRNQISNSSIFGIWLSFSSYGNIISENNFTRSNIWLYNSCNDNNISANNLVIGKIDLERSDSNIISENIITNSSSGGMYLDNSDNNIISDNNIHENEAGIVLGGSSENTVFGNTITNNTCGILVHEDSSDNSIYYNNFINNTQQAYDEGDNTWDDGYPSGGNYWDDYDGDDIYHGPDQDILGADNIGDTPYDISGGINQDNYPLMHPWGVEEFILNLDDFPMYEAESPYNEMCGSAVAQMTLNYIWWNSSNDTIPPMKFDNQSWLYDRGIENNSNPDLPYFDTQGMWHTIQYNKPMPYSEYGYNFAKYNNENVTEVLKRICLYINYTIGTVGGYKPGHPLHVPAVVPAYGNYSNWMAIRGFRSNRTAHPMPDELTVYGFWVNDPYPSSLGGLGENSYKTLAWWISNYYYPLELESDDPYDNKYVAILEPPEITNDPELNVATSPARFNAEERKVIRQVQLNIDAISESLRKQVDEWVIQAAIDGVAEQLIPYDDDFTTVFERAIPGSPIFVKNLDGNDYYAVPFITPLTLSTIKGVKSIHLDRNTVSVVLIDAEDGSFKEASWVKNPVEYLPVSKADALAIVYDILKEISINSDNIDTRDIRTILVYRDSSPYYPDWKITLNDWVFFVDQDGTVSY